MKLSIRGSAFLMVLLPTLVPALALSVWFTVSRVADARDELQSRGEREATYLAGAAELGLLVGDDAALARLARSNVRAPGAAKVVLFLDTGGSLLAAAGSSWEIGLALNCWRGAADCLGGEQRRLFGREVRSRAESDDDPAFGTGRDAAAEPSGALLGQVVLSYDPQDLASLQRGLFLNAAGSTLVALLVAAFISGLASRRLSTPMQQLSQVVSRIQAGDLAARTEPGGTGELRELEEGVNAMAERVETGAAEQARLVDEATAGMALANLELGRQNRELDAALASAEAGNRAKDLFLARMSHELRTPLTTVIGYARLMQQAQSAGQRADFYRPVEQASNILKRTVDDILDLARLDSGAVSLEHRVFDLGCCIEDAAVMFAPAAQSKGLDLVCHIGRDVPIWVTGDSIRVSQVLGNLLGNAVKFTERGCIHVRARVLEEAAGRVRVQLEVLDTGEGMAAGRMSNLFQPFTQADESITRRFGGSGLGLSISARIVATLQGSIRLESELGRGTRAVVELPLELAPPGVPLPALVGVRVAVLADDRSPQLPVVQDYLEAAGCELLRVDAEGPAADLLLCIEDRPLQLPEASGLPVLRLLSVERLGGLPVGELATGLPLPLRRRELLAAGMKLLGRKEPMAAGAAAELPAAQPHFSLRCLLVEDNALNRRMLVTSLGNAGLQVIEAAGGAQALACLAEYSTDLVLLDVHMPDMDGVTLARAIRRRDLALPLYALTANVTGSEEEALAAAGVAEVLYKPIDEQRLREVFARHEDNPACELRAASGVTPDEVLAELSRLERAITQALGAGRTDEARELAHQMLGAARLFTTGELGVRSQVLESAARDADLPGAFAALGRVRRVIHLLERQRVHAAGGSPGVAPA